MQTEEQKISQAKAFILEVLGDQMRSEEIVDSRFVWDQHAEEPKIELSLWLSEDSTIFIADQTWTDETPYSAYAVLFQIDAYLTDLFGTLYTHEGSDGGTDVSFFADIA